MVNSEINTAGNLEQAEAARACHYAVLARLFDDQTTGADIKRYLDLLHPFADHHGDPAGPFSRKLRQWLDREGVDRLLNTEYTRLFIMPGGIRPYESVYRGESPILMQDPWLEARRFYQRCGLKLDNPAHHPDDHVAVELTFMVYLIEAGDLKNEQEAFFRRHLRVWMPRILEEIAQYHKARFYKDVADYGCLFLENEQRYFNLTPEEALKFAINDNKGVNIGDEDGSI